MQEGYHQQSEWSSGQRTASPHHQAPALAVTFHMQLHVVLKSVPQRMPSRSPNSTGLVKDTDPQSLYAITKHSSSPFPTHASRMSTTLSVSPRLPCFCPSLKVSTPLTMQSKAAWYSGWALDWQSRTWFHSKLYADLECDLLHSLPLSVLQLPNSHVGIVMCTDMDMDFRRSGLVKQT